MNVQKARDYFSAYCEGTLDRGLKQQFEHAVEKDAGLRKELEEFRAMFGELEQIRNVEILVPADLNEKIQARLDLHVWEEKQKAPAPWTFWLRNLGFASLGAVAIFGAVNGLNSRGDTAQAGMASMSGTAKVENQLVATWDDEEVQLSYQPRGQSTVVVRSGDGAELKRVTLDQAEWAGELKNPNPKAAVFSVQIEGEAQGNVFVVPGSDRSTDVTGNGNLLEFATVIADVHGVPVWVRAQDASKSFTWTLNPRVPVMESISAGVTAPSFRAETLEGGVISLRQS